MYLVRVLVVGDSNVGKTSLVNRFHDNDLKNVIPSIPTIGVVYSARDIVVQAQSMKIQLWDLSGLAKYDG